MASLSREKEYAKRREYRQKLKEECLEKYTAFKEDGNRERRERRQRYKAENPEKYAALKQQDLLERRRWNEKHPEAQRIYSLKRKFDKHYGISIEDYERMYSDQWGMCAICGTQKKSAVKSNAGRGKVLCVDHCHDSGKVRHLLCGNCNTMLGMSNDDLFVLQNAVDYVKSFKNQSPAESQFG